MCSCGGLLSVFCNRYFPSSAAAVRRIHVVELEGHGFVGGPKEHVWETFTACFSSVVGAGWQTTCWILLMVAWMAQPSTGSCYWRVRRDQVPA